MKKLIYVSMLAAVLLAACGPQATPTMNPADVQATAFSAASTMVAMTQAAIPTATPVPPTETPSPTPVPTDTPVPLSTTTGPVALPTLAAAPTAAASGGDPCNAPLASSPDGPTATIKVDNQTSGQMNISLYLNKTAFGECGYRGYSVARNGSVLVTLPQGCYSAYAWINAKNPSTVSGGGYCINNSDKWTFIVRDGGINLAPP